MNLFSLLDQTALRYPDHGAVFRGLEQVHTWRALRARALSLAAGIRQRCTAGDRIALVSENRVEFPELMKLEGCALAWRRALDSAQLQLSDLSFVETHDCFTVAELIEYEAMGLTPPGEGATAIREGWTQVGGVFNMGAAGVTNDVSILERVR